ncbi:MAG: tRNA-dihydrouridine synthase family protein [Lentisphaeria bacterium]|nr:tRNA-dihydrouridine synthase family protein [Lentisphaeria bacterium]
MVEYQRTFPYNMKHFPYQPATMLAPMEGFSNAALRQAIAHCGKPGVLCTEFIRVNQSKITPRMMKKHVIKVPGIPLSVQVMGNVAELMADSAGALVDAGADIVDVNLGCPTQRAAKANVGAALLKDPKRLYKILSDMRKQIPETTWFSAKIRAGFEESDHVLTIAKAVEAAGCDFIIVHPRRGKDVYQGKADWRIIALIKQTVNIPVVANGDVFYPKDVVAIRETTQADAVMIGRGALRNPWIFRQINEMDAGENMFRPEPMEIFEWMIEYFESLSVFLETKPDRILPKFKELSRHMFRLIRDPKDFMKTSLRTQTNDDFIADIRKGFEQIQSEELCFF